MKKLLGVLFVFLLVLVLAGCAPKNADKAKEKLEKKDYTVEVVKNDNAISRGIIEAAAKDAEAIVGFSKKTDDGYIAGTAILFESAKAAKEFYKDNKDDVKEGQKVVLLGKWVVGGDEQAVKDFK